MGICQSNRRLDRIIYILLSEVDVQGSSVPAKFTADISFHYFGPRITVLCCNTRGDELRHEMDVNVSDDRCEIRSHVVYLEDNRTGESRLIPGSESTDNEYVDRFIQAVVKRMTPKLVREALYLTLNKSS